MENPGQLMTNAIESINDKIKQVCKEFDIDFFQVEAWLIENEPERFNKAEWLLSGIDNNISSQYLSGDLMPFALQTWQNVLNNWVESWVSMLRLYWQANKKKKVA